MHRLGWFLVTLAVVGFTFGTGHGDPPDNPATRAEPQATEWWTDRHDRKLVHAARENIDLVLLGDSITQNYERPEYWPVWQRFYARRRAVNLGFAGDTTGNVLWRLQHGEVEHIHPRIVMVMIGTNNSGVYHGWPAEQTQAGIDAIVSDLRARLPSTQILLLGILPTAISEWKQTTDAAVNRYLADRYRNTPYVTFLDVSHVFMKDGHIDITLYSDPRETPPRPALHPDPVGQERMAQAIEPTLSALLHDSLPDKER